MQKHALEVVRYGTPLLSEEENYPYEYSLLFIFSIKDIFIQALLASQILISELIHMAKHISTSSRTRGIDLCYCESQIKISHYYSTKVPHQSYHQRR